MDRIYENVIVSDSIDSSKEINDSLIICDDSQTELKGNKTLTELILNKWQKNISIIQRKQYTQNTDSVQKMNADYFVLLGSFIIGECKYFTEKFMSCISPEFLYKLIKYINKNNYFFLWTDREENICLGFKKEVIVNY